MVVAEFRNEQTAAHPEYRDMLPSEVDALINKSLDTFASTYSEAHLSMVKHDLIVVMIPHVTIAIVVLLVLVLIVYSKMPDTGKEEDPLRLVPLLKRL